MCAYIGIMHFNQYSICSCKWSLIKNEQIGTDWYLSHICTSILRADNSTEMSAYKGKRAFLCKLRHMHAEKCNQLSASVNPTLKNPFITWWHCKTDLKKGGKKNKKLFKNLKNNKFNKSELVVTYCMESVLFDGF